MFQLTVAVFHVGLREHVGIYGIDCFFPWIGCHPDPSLRDGQQAPV